MRLGGDGPNPTLLDHMLYAWLAEADDRRFDQAFRLYYESASPSLIRYLARCSSLGDLDCEQIAVDALLKFFCRAGRDRRQAAKAVADALTDIRPLGLGPFDDRQVERWTGEVDGFRHTSMTFTPASERDAERPWKAQIQTHTERIAPLQRQGLSVLDAVRSVCVAIAGLASPTESVDPDDDPSQAPPGQYAAIRAFARAWREMAESGDVAGSAAEARHPGVTRCVGGSWAVVESLPALRIPTNGYLFDIAHSLYLDECKSRGRKKRGGAGFSSGEPDAGGSSALVRFEFDEEAAESEEGGGDEAGASGHVAFAHRLGALAADSTADIIDEDFCERFFDYLSKPLDDAQEAYRQAACAGKAEAARKRLASVSEKHARFMSVLSMRIEGQTQEAIADALGLSRNQVKYIAEQAQEAYLQFCAAAKRPGRP